MYFPIRKPLFKKENVEKQVWFRVRDSFQKSACAVCGRADEKHPEQWPGHSSKNTDNQLLLVGYWWPRKSYITTDGRCLRKRTRTDFRGISGGAGKNLNNCGFTVNRRSAPDTPPTSRRLCDATESAGRAFDPMPFLLCRTVKWLHGVRKNSLRLTERTPERKAH